MNAFNTTGVTLLTAGPGITLDDSLRTKGYGEVRGLVDVAIKGAGFVDGGAKFNNQFTTIAAKDGVRYRRP